LRISVASVLVVEKGIASKAYDWTILSMGSEMAKTGPKSVAGSVHSNVTGMASESALFEHARLSVIVVFTP
jgi:hypothetical protein